MKNKKKGVLIAVVVIALIVVAVAAVCINKKAGDSGKLKEGQTEATVKKSIVAQLSRQKSEIFIMN